MGRTGPRNQLAARERQILDLIYRLQQASVGDVLEQLTDPPSYSAVRTMMRQLEKKGFLKHREESGKFIYRPTQSREKASKSALLHLISTFFSGSPSDAMAAILDATSEILTEEDLARMEQLIEQAKKEGV